MRGGRFIRRAFESILFFREKLGKDFCIVICGFNEVLDGFRKLWRA
jgi:hypothetical protein